MIDHWYRHEGWHHFPVIAVQDQGKWWLVDMGDTEVRYRIAFLKQTVSQAPTIGEMGSIFVPADLRATYTVMIGERVVREGIPRQ